MCQNVVKDKEILKRLGETLFEGRVVECEPKVLMGEAKNKIMRALAQSG